MGFCWAVSLWYSQTLIDELVMFFSWLGCYPMWVEVGSLYPMFLTNHVSSAKHFGVFVFCLLRVYEKIANKSWVNMFLCISDTNMIWLDVLSMLPACNRRLTGWRH